MINRTQDSALKQYHVSAFDLERKLPQLVEDGVTELVVSDSAITGNKKRFLHLLETADRVAPSVHLIFAIDNSVIDREVCNSCASSYCSLHIECPSFIDKKLFSKKATLLNDMGIVFGYDMVIGGGEDNLKKFRERLDFILSLYPNHIDFPQLEEKPVFEPTSFFSRQDFTTALTTAFACSLFYTSGRAVPWFLSVIDSLRITPSRFFADFSEWQQCNNCSLQSGFDISTVTHEEIEKMQLLFLRQKYEEKKLSDVFAVVSDLIKLHGAFSRVASSGIESELELSWNPDDLLSPEVLDLICFFEQVCMAPCRVKVYDAGEGPDFRII